MIDSELQTPYRPAPILTILVIAGLIIFAILDLMHIPAGIIGMYGLGVLGGGEPNQDLVDISVLIRGLSGLGQLIMMIYMAICFGMLMYRFAYNARTLGFTGFSHSPGWVVGWYFVPFAHLIMPYKAIVEVWKASKAKVEIGMYPEWWDESSGLLIKAWWFFWIVGTITNNMASRLSRSTSLESFGMSMVPIASILQVTSAFLCITVVYKFSKQQNIQARALHEIDSAPDSSSKESVCVDEHHC